MTTSTWLKRNENVILVGVVTGVVTAFTIFGINQLLNTRLSIQLAESKAKLERAGIN